MGEGGRADAQLDRVARLRLLFGVIAVLAGLWTIALYAGYGQSVVVGPLRLSSRNPTRALLLCALAIAAYAFVSGSAGLRQDLSRLTRGAYGVARTGAGGFTLLEVHVNPALVALLMAAASVGISFLFRESTAGGSDAYAYVTQADLLISGAPGLRVELPIAAAAPWPNAIGTFTTFGYRATPDHHAIVPVTAPGLPLLMAAFKIAFGHCAMFWVVPLSGGLLVWATFAAGRQAVSSSVGLAASWLVATSPTFLSMSRSVMSDVPAAAFWALALACVLRPSVIASLAAGLSASAAILIRPNLLPIAVMLGVWLLWRQRGQARFETRLPKRACPPIVVAFAAGLLPGVVAVLLVNRWLYGSPLSSGYGSLTSLFSFGNVALNSQRYARWLAETQTPIAIAGVVALLTPWRRLWPTSASRDAAWLLGLVLFAVFALYAAYNPFEEWWYLRFFLPAWPSIFIGTGALIVGLARGRSPLTRAIAALAIVALGVRGVSAAQRLGVYSPGEGERRYATVAELVARVTDPSSVIVTTAHIGAMRYYGGRLTVRYDELDASWLDRTLAWFVQRGRKPYILLEEQEVPEFKQRFAAASATGRLEMAPMLVYEAHQIAGRVYLFDPFGRVPETWKPEPIVDPQPRCPLPAERPPDYSGR